jgi:hypothetical protein
MVAFKVAPSLLESFKFEDYNSAIAAGETNQTIRMLLVIGSHSESLSPDAVADQPLRQGEHLD